MVGQPALGAAGRTEEEVGGPAQDQHLEQGDDGVAGPSDPGPEARAAGQGSGYMGFALGEVVGLGVVDGMAALPREVGDHQRCVQQVADRVLEHLVLGEGAVTQGQKGPSSNDWNGGDGQGHCQVHERSSGRDLEAPVGNGRSHVGSGGHRHFDNGHEARFWSVEGRIEESGPTRSVRRPARTVTRWASIPYKLTN